MVRKRKDRQETAISRELPTEPVIIEGLREENQLRSTMDEVRKQEGIIGYILRDTTSALVDLNDSTKIVDYAILSSSGFEASRDFLELFELGDPDKTVIEGENIKILCLMIGDSKISVFMEKNADIGHVLRILRRA